MRLCRELRDRGVCSKGESCVYSHFLKLCELCGALLQSLETFDQHYSSAHHIERSFRNGTGTDGICKTCCEPYNPGAENVEKFLEHSRTRAHLACAKERPEVVEMKLALTVMPPWTEYCHICNILIPKKEYERHIFSRKHNLIKEYLETISLASPESFVDVVLDFGVVDPLKQASTMAINIKLMKSMNITLVDIQMASSTDGLNFPRQNHFTPSPWRGKIKYPGDYGLPLEFLAKGLNGRFEDRIKLVFSASRDGVSRNFVVVRDVLAVVAAKPELDQLAPISEYKKPGAPLGPPSQIIPGIKTSALSGVRWTVPLPRYPIPQSLLQILEDEEDNPTKISFSLDALLPPDFTVETYSKYWSTALHVEEVQLMRSLGHYDMRGQELITKGQFHVLTVPGVLRKRPSVVIGDQIYVRKAGTDAPWYSGFVHNVNEKQVYLRFSDRFSNIAGQAYDVYFSLCRTALRRMHQGLHTPWNPAHILFPEEDHISGMRPPSPIFVESLHLYNRELNTNAHQKMAVASILCQRPGSVPFVVFGPPGTGKTVVVVEAMRQILNRDPQARLLACAPSNSAADLLADRLRQSGMMPSQLLRLNALARPMTDLSRTLLPYSKLNDGSFVIPDPLDLKEYSIVVSTCVTASVLHAVGIPRGHYGHIFIDEAGQALEPESMIPIKTLGGPYTNVVLAGDPKQLGPIVRSRYARRFGASASIKLHISYLERLMSNDIYQLPQGVGTTIVKLVQNFRSHPAILKFPNEKFYKGELVPCGNPMVINSLERWERLVTPGFPIIFHAVKGKDLRESTSPSWFNPVEATIVKHYVQTLRENLKLRLTDNDIGVITPYNGQVRKIDSLINTPELKRGRHGDLKVGSVEDFQGQERRVIIVSCVRSNKNFVHANTGERECLGFVTEHPRFNVAVTRAQALLICIGDPTVLSLDSMWRKFLDYVHAGGGWTGAPKDWRTEEMHRNFVKLRREDEVRIMEGLMPSAAERALNEDEGIEELGMESGLGLEEQPWREPE